MSGTDIEATTAARQLERVASPLDDLARMGKWLWASEHGGNNPEAKQMASALKMVYVDRLGLPLHAASDVYLIQGQFVLSAKMKRALAHRDGIHVQRVDVTDDSCTAVVIDKHGRELGRTTYTLAQAAKQGLKGSNWSNNPDRMLWARASSRALDDFAPWVTVGMVAREDVDGFEDADPDEALHVGVVVDEDGKPFEDAD